MSAHVLLNLLNDLGLPFFFNNEILQRNYRKIQSSCGSHFFSWNFTKES